MEQQLKDDLCEYLGELSYSLHNTFYWFEKQVILEKIHSVNVLLNQKRGAELSWLEKFNKLINKNAK